MKLLESTTPSATPIDLPIGLTRKARSCLAWAIILSGGGGEVPGGIGELSRVLDTWKWHVCEALAELEATGLVRRTGKSQRMRLFVVDPYTLSGKPDRCENCRTREASGRWCPQCRQGFTSRLSWREQAIQLALAGKSVYAIHVATKVSLWGTGGLDDGRVADRDRRKIERGTEDGIIPYLVEVGFLPRSMLALRARAFGGAVMAEE